MILTEDIRPDAAETLAYFHQQGVDAKVISGDSPETVAAVAVRPGSPPLTAASSLPWTHVPCLLVQAAGTRRMRTWGAWPTRLRAPASWDASPPSRNVHWCGH